MPITKAASTSSSPTLAMVETTDSRSFTARANAAAARRT